MPTRYVRAVDLDVEVAVDAQRLVVLEIWKFFGMSG